MDEIILVYSFMKSSPNRVSYSLVLPNTNSALPSYHNIHGAAVCRTDEIWLGSTKSVNKSEKEKVYCWYICAEHKIVSLVRYEKKKYDFPFFADEPATRRKTLIDVTVGVYMKCSQCHASIWKNDTGVICNSSCYTIVVMRHFPTCVPRLSGTRSVECHC